MTDKQKIGVLSGTFDPFHIAHLEACLVAMAACDLDTVTIITERSPRRKQAVTNYKTRVHIIDLASSDYPKLRQLDVADEVITTSNTLPILHEQFGDAEFWYILGSDVVEHLYQWDGIEDLFANFKLCVVLRSNKDKKITEAKLELLKESYPQIKYLLLPEVWSPVSSSVIRKQIKKSGYSPYLHRDVLKYVITNSVY